MTDSPKYGLLTIENLEGNGGNFILDTDLDSETKSDKIKIIASQGGTTYVKVKDVSLSTDIEVIGKKNLLLIADASEKAKFVGEGLNVGGLWDVTPTIENGLNVKTEEGKVLGSKDQWYLTKLEKKVNNDTNVLLNSNEHSYALWRNTNDSLRSRLGDLHSPTMALRPESGMWGRLLGGKFASAGFDSHYNMYQLGYDKAADAKSNYGLVLEHGNGRASYTLGRSKDKMFGVGLYGTWQGDDGSYTDVVARLGQFNTDLNSYGNYPDNASYKTKGYSISAEYGKKFVLDKKSGVFIEPHAQLMLGRVQGQDYTTARGSVVTANDINSLLGRIGVLMGQKIAQDNSIYLKAAVLREFNASQDIKMSATNGEHLTTTQDYGDTWFEVGIGANVKLGKNSFLYGDLERSFGASIQKTWRINTGVRFDF